MAVDAGVVHERRRGLRRRWKIAAAGWLLRRDPRGKLRGSVGVNANQHLGVLRSAVLRALAEIEAGVCRIDPHGVDLIGNQIHLAGQSRNPEAMVDIRGRHGQIGRRRVRGIADRNVQFVGGDDAEFRIAILPPELMADHHDIERGRGLGACSGWQR